MIEIVNSEIEAYARKLTTPPPGLLDELWAVTHASVARPDMQVGHVEGMFLHLLVRITAARRGVEVGMFTGYSTLMMASALPDDGEIVTCEVNPEAETVARRFFGRSPHGRKIRVLMGPALETLQGLSGPLDFAFIDADKANYIPYYETLLPLVRPGGWIAVDNTLWSGRVLDPPPQQDDATRVIETFNNHVAQDDRVNQVLLTIRDGVTLIWKKSVS